ncbi:MAG: alkylation response protein AidB-like acyl-CoA dehydrogenase [Myxococcota bacterium]|jgi:alkylation response protein AidB-like acyl-CoA dehydrogenase
MDFALGDDLDLVIETTRKLAEDVLAPELRESEHARSVSPELRAAWNEIGLAALDAPEEVGGAELGCLARMVVNEELAAADAGAAIALDPYGPALACVFEVGGKQAAIDFIQSLPIENPRALFLSELDANVSVNDGQVTLDAPWVAADSADAIVLLLENEVVVLREDFSFTPLRGAGLRAAGASRLRADLAPIAARWEDADGASRALGRARLYYASLLVGVMRAACDFSAQYAQEREAFGKPIAHHQALAFLIAEMRMSLDATRLLVRHAAWRADAGLSFCVEASSAWAECIDVSRTLGPNAVQILGGHGFMADYPVEKYMREARALGLVCGGFDAAIEHAGQFLVGSTEPLALSSLGAQ